MGRYWLGIDIGSVSVDGAIVDENNNILKDYYIRHHGNTLKTVEALFGLISKEIDFAGIVSIAVTGVGGKMISEMLNCHYVNEVVAFSEANSILYPEVRTLIEIGGEDARFIALRYEESLGKTVIHDFAMNQLCAAGTGSFLDQQASRLGVPIEDFGKLALQSHNPARIAGRCSVFAKTDMIHLQQKATPVEDIVAGLCFAFARNFKSVIAKNREFNKCISFQGGLAANIGVVRAFENILGLSLGEIFIPPNYATLGAIGSAIISKHDGKPFVLNIKEIQKRLKLTERINTKLTRLGKGYYAPRQNQEDDKLSPIKYNGMHVYIGVDVGSISTNLAVINKEGELIAKKYLMTAGQPLKAVGQGLKELGEEIGSRVNVKGVCTTGSGRHMIADVIGADIVKNEITAQARAAVALKRDVDTIFEIGGQDSKYIRIKDGVVVDFEMNKICSAGTGSFLEEQAERLNIKINGEFGQLALKAKQPVELGERCTVFMGTNIGHYQSKGVNNADIVAGLCYSIVNNYLDKVVRKKKIGECILFQGGVAFNKGVHAAFEKVTGKKILIPPHHEVTGAIGCALIARESVKEKSLFKGFSVAGGDYKVRFFSCRDCSNDCEINEIKVGEESWFYGSRCGKYDLSEEGHSYLAQNIFTEREKLLHLYKIKDAKNKLSLGLKMGIPRCMVAFYEYFPFWNAFFMELGFDVVLSDMTNKGIVQEGLERAVSDYCFPIKVSHGHITNLMKKKVDFIFLPHIIDLFRIASMKNTYTCPYVQSLPSIMETSLDIKEKGVGVFAPVLHYRRGKEHIKSVLRKALERYNIPQDIFELAYDRANENQLCIEKEVKERGEKLLKDLGPDEKAIVVLGRLYNTCDPLINLQIPTRLNERRFAVISIDALPLDDIDISNEWAEMYWHHGIRILKAAKFISETRNLFAVYLTNFSCGPDSFILSFFYRAMKGKPFLEIEVDEHSADVGIITRCEAFLESLANINVANNVFH